MKKNPMAVALGRRGGKVGGVSRSHAKLRAARQNGRLGGRPRETQTPAPRRPALPRAWDPEDVG